MHKYNVHDIERLQPYGQFRIFIIHNRIKGLFEARISCDDPSHLLHLTAKSCETLDEAEDCFRDLCNLVKCPVGLYS